MVQIIKRWWWGWGKIWDYVADVPYECWEWESKAISWDKVYAKVSAMDTTLNTALQPWDNVSELCNDAWYWLACDIPTDNCQLANGCCYVTSWDLPDFSCYQLKSNMVTSLSWADNDHYPTAKAVSDALSCAWSWDMLKSVYDPNNKNSDAFDYCNFINTPTIPSVIDNLTSSCTWEALSAKQWCVLNACVTSINDKIPSEATCSNKLADKNYVDNSINSVTAYYITKNAQGEQWATYAELAAATTFYSGWVARTPTRNDYTIVLSDENHDNATTRYIYNSGWEYQYTVNETALTQSQLDALNSWITAAKVSCYDWVVTTVWSYWDIVTHNVCEFATATQWGKADTAIQPNDNITCLCNNAWYITWVAWGGITWTLSDQTDLNNTLWNKANDNAVVKLTWAQTVCGTKTFCTSPVVPSKTSDATNCGTAVATEAQVYKKQDKLTAQTAYTNKWTATKVPTISTNNLWQVTSISETSITWLLPSWWSEWQVLTKTASWCDWCDASGWGGWVWYIDYLMVWWWWGGWCYWAWWWGWVIEMFCQWVYWIQYPIKIGAWWAAQWDSLDWRWWDTIFMWMAYWWWRWGSDVQQFADWWVNSWWWGNWAIYSAGLIWWWAYCWWSRSSCSAWWWGWWAWWNWCNASERKWWDWWIWVKSSISWTQYWYWWWWWGSSYRASWSNPTWCWVDWWWDWWYYNTNWCDATYYGWWWWWKWGRWYQWVVIIRYKTDWSCWVTTASTWWCKYTCWAYTIHCFTSDWVFTPILW